MRMTVQCPQKVREQNKNIVWQFLKNIWTLYDISKHYGSRLGPTKRMAFSSIHINYKLVGLHKWLELWGYWNFVNFTNCPRTFGGHCIVQETDKVLQKSNFVITIPIQMVWPFILFISTGQDKMHVEGMHESITKLLKKLFYLSSTCLTEAIERCDINQSTGGTGRKVY